ncbi:hypothetical protein ACF1G0_22505 [Streptomyces sp. NPDC013953]|uniref:hypothetical protein n=1 Tax=Streptomyces sp. NPDC013953 TaxID=3364868 RepID=UPI003701D9EC
MRFATYCLDHRRFVALAEQGDEADALRADPRHRGELGIVFAGRNARERLTVRVERSGAPDPEGWRAVLLSSYPERRTAVEERLLDLSVEAVDGAALDRSPRSGELRSVVDTRG